MHACPFYTNDFLMRMLANIEDLYKIPDDAAFYQSPHYLPQPHCRSTQGTIGKSHRTVTIHQKTIKVQQTALSFSADY